MRENCMLLMLQPAVPTMHQEHSSFNNAAVWTSCGVQSFGDICMYICMYVYIYVYYINIMLCCFSSDLIETT